MSRSLWRFHALDSWFFKEARPMESVGGSELSSVFPPPTRTVVGAIRSAIGHFNQVDWSSYPKNHLALEQQIGDSQHYGLLHVKAVYLSLQVETGDWDRLYPAPLNLVATKKQQLDSIYRLQIGKPLHCDLGRAVCMPMKAGDIWAKKTLSLGDYWLKESSFFNVLQGETPDASEFIANDSLFAHESRIGIAINKQSRHVEDQMLYQTRHIRPDSKLALSVELEGLEENIQPQQGVVRLGAEGRGSAFTVTHHQTIATLKKPDISKETDPLKGVMLVLLSPLEMPSAKEYSPLPGFKKASQNGITVWTGQINGVDLSLYTAVTGKMQRKGGWDLKNHTPRPVENFIPAGSVFYCTVTHMDIENALNKLHLQQIDSHAVNKALGRGLFAAGLWYQHESLI